MVGSSNTLNGLSNRVHVPNKTEDLRLHVFYMITGINESKTLTKHISCECECKLDGRKCNSNQKWNNSKCKHACKNPKEHNACKKDYIWNPATCSCENGKYVGSIIVDLLITCDEVIDIAKIVPTKSILTKFNER